MDFRSAFRLSIGNTEVCEKLYLTLAEYFDQMTEFRKIAIIGLGLIASSICLSLRQKDPAIQIAGYNKDKG